MKTTNKLSLLVAVGLTAVSASAQFTIIGSGMLHPESIISDGKFIYTTEIGKELKPTDKDGDGAIHKLSLSGELLEYNMAKDTLNAPKGTAIIGKTLYVADIDRVVGIDIVTGKKVAEISFSTFNAKFLNDIAVKDENNLFVSSTGDGKIFSVILGKQPVIEELAIPAIKGPNGLYYDKKIGRLYVVGLNWGTTPEGEIGVVSWQEGKPKYEPLVDVKGFYDGIQLIDDNTLIVSDWGVLREKQGVLKKINLKEKTCTTILLDEKIGGPADIYFDAKSKSILIPVLLEGKVARYVIK